MKIHPVGQPCSTAARWSRSGWRRVLPAAVFLLASAEAVRAQALRYDYHRNMTEGAMRYRDISVYDDPLGARSPTKEPPTYSTLRIGPFYSTATFAQSAGYRYVRTEGSGTDFLFTNRRGQYIKDGSEFPLISTLDLRSYLLVTEHMDVDLSCTITYAQYPLNTQEDEFFVDFVDEGFFGTLSTSFNITSFLTAMLYDRLTYRTDYVDTRGMEDRYGGERYRYLDNEVGLILNWRLAKDKSVVGILSREDFIPQDDEFSAQERITYREGLTYSQMLMSGLTVGGRVLYSQTEYTASNRNKWNQQDYSLFADFSQGVGDESGLGLQLTRFTKIRVGVGYSAGYATQQGVSETQTTVEQGGASQSSTLSNNPESESSSGVLTGFASLTTALRKDLSHTLDYRRGLRTGFSSDYEVFTEYGYRIDWRGALSTASFFTRLSEVEPSDERVSSYSNWLTGLNGTYPLTRFATLFGASTYTVRENKVTPDVDTSEPEWVNDYQTWVSRIGTSFAVTKSITFVTYYEHTERYSDEATLEYTRDVFEATFTYRHAF